MSNTALTIVTEAWVNWFKEQALPRWSGDAINSENGASYERFLPSGEADVQANTRMRVQARQMFVFATAGARGWMDADLSRSVVERLADFSKTRGRHASGDGYLHVLAADYSVADGKRDLYDHAFFLLSCAARYKAFADEKALDDADDIVRFLDSELGQVGGGWLEGDYDSDRRRQNPHMHMFEAFLSLYDASGNAKWLGRAGEIFTLFETRFFDPKYGVLREYFNHDWSLLDGADGDIIEPGHMMEWVWLLRWYERCSGRDTAYYADAMYEKALADGLTEEGLLFDEVSPSGAVLKASKRCWPMTELIKASLVQAQHGYVGAEKQATVALQRLMDAYVSTEHPGLYIDQLGEGNEILVDFSPASTLYHLIMATIEADNYCA